MNNTLVIDNIIRCSILVPPMGLLSDYHTIMFRQLTALQKANVTNCVRGCSQRPGRAGIMRPCLLIGKHWRPE